MNQQILPRQIEWDERNKGYLDKAFATDSTLA
jgi:hypothetical protein